MHGRVPGVGRHARADDRRHPAAGRPGQRRGLRLRASTARSTPPAGPTSSTTTPGRCCGCGPRTSATTTATTTARPRLLRRRRSSPWAAPTTRSCSTASATPAVRRQQLAASIKALPADTFAPFTTAEWIQMNQFTEAYTGCLDWPAPTHPADPPVRPGSDGRDPRAGADPQRRPGLADPGRRAARTSRGRSARPPDRSWCPTWCTWSRSTTGTAAERRSTRRFVRQPGPAGRRSTPHVPQRFPRSTRSGSSPGPWRQPTPATVTRGSATQRPAPARDASWSRRPGTRRTGSSTSTTPTTWGCAAGGPLLGARVTTSSRTCTGSAGRPTRRSSGTATTDYYGLGVDGTLTVRDGAGHRLTGHVHWTTTGAHTVATVVTATARYRLPAP